MTGFVRVRHRMRVLALVAVVVSAFVCAPPARAASSGEVTRPLAESNTALLSRAADVAARQLVARVPLAPGTRVGLRPEGTDVLDADMREALLRALNSAVFDSASGWVTAPLLAARAAGARTKADTTTATRTRMR